MLSLSIDGKVVTTDEGKTILQIAKQNNIDIPTLCYHPALEPFGGCRLCTVEIISKGRKRLVTSCNYPVEEGLEIYTGSQDVIETRKWLLELLLARCPNVEIIQRLARHYGIEKTRFKLKDERCMLCGLCVRICDERMGRSAINFVGRGIDRKVDTPFHIQTDVCMACGACAFICPTGAIKIEDIAKHKPLPILSEFDQGLKERSPIYVPYPQGVPNIPVIDRDKCVHFLTGECGVCQEVCPAEAINYEQVDEIIEIEVGAITFCPGFDKFDPTPFSNYGYKRYPNVVTSIEFERMLSSSGPFEGELLRPSDRTHPQRIAWIQCVGSRDLTFGHSYCSTVCCTYAIKEAIVAKEHSPVNLDTTIFFIDMRTFGKGFEAYSERAKKEHGVRFIRCRPASIEEVPNTKDLKIKYETEDGRFVQEEFNLVVLSIGLEPPKGADKLAEKLEIELNNHGFCKTPRFSPVAASRPGIFVCGAFSGPKDIPDTVTQASATAAQTSALLSSVRNTLVKKIEYPPERDISGEKPRIGVFVCHCGINIGGVVDVPAVKEYAATLPNVAFVDENLYSCSQDTQERIKEKIGEMGLNRVVVAACTPRTHQPLYQDTLREAGLNPYLFEMANIREQCSWVHMDEKEAATQKAAELVRIAVAKASLLKPLKQLSLELNHAGLVIGGGISGMVAALSLAEQGFEVHLVERAPVLGGIARRIHHTLEGGDVQAYLSDLVHKVRENPLIKIYTEARISEVSGYIGNFTTKIRVGAEQQIKEIVHGVAIIATGGQEYNSVEYLYGKDARVLSLLELGEEINKGDGKIADCTNLVMIQCVGSREADRLYCSRICCSKAIQCALKLKEIKPEMNIYILYRDMMTYGLKEDYYQEARTKGITFLRYNLEDKPEVQIVSQDNQNLLRVIVKDPILGDYFAIDTDILALGVATTPSDGNKELSQLFKVPLDQYGFFVEAHAKLRPVDFAVAGVFMCGLAHGPKFIEESIAQAKAAASRAAMVLVKDAIIGEGIVASVNEALCSGCGVCEVLCPYKAIVVDREKGVSVVNEALCMGCGTCCAACPSGAVEQRGFTTEEISAMLSAALTGG